jgi:hypothetical protein
MKQGVFLSQQVCMHLARSIDNHITMQEVLRRVLKLWLETASSQDDDGVHPNSRGAEMHPESGYDASDLRIGALPASLPLPWAQREPSSVAWPTPWPNLLACFPPRPHCRQDKHGAAGD